MVPMGLSERPHIAQGIYIPSLKVLDGYRGPYTVGQMREKRMRVRERYRSVVL